MLDFQCRVKLHRKILYWSAFSRKKIVSREAIKRENYFDPLQLATKKYFLCSKTNQKMGLSREKATNRLICGSLSFCLDSVAFSERLWTKGCHDRNVFWGDFGKLARFKYITGVNYPLCKAKRSRLCKIPISSSFQNLNGSPLFQALLTFICNI